MCDNTHRVSHWYVTLTRTDTNGKVHKAYVAGPYDDAAQADTFFVPAAVRATQNEFHDRFHDVVIAKWEGEARNAPKAVFSWYQLMTTQVPDELRNCIDAKRRAPVAHDDPRPVA